MLLKKSDSQLIQRALRYVRPYKLQVGLALLTIISGIIINLIQPVLWAKLLVNLFGKNFQAVLTTILFVLLVYLASTAARFVQSYLLAYLSEQIIFDLKNDIYGKILILPVQAFDDMRIGDFISRIQGDVGGVAEIITNQLLNTIVEGLRVILIGVLLFNINIYLALLVIIGFPLTYFIFYKFGIKIRYENEKFFGFNDSYFSHIQQSLAGIREIKSLGAGDINLKSFLALSTELKMKTIKMALLNNFSQLLAQLISFSTQIIVMLAGGYFVYRSLLTLERFIAFSSYAGQFAGSLLNITSVNSYLQKVLTSLERVFGLLDNLNYTGENPGKLTVTKIKGRITFNNILFHYNQGHEVLRGVSFHITNNSKLAIVGPSGSGKTTLFNLLLRFYKPTSGHILIDNIDLNELDEVSMRKHISIVHQEPYFFCLSIQDNLRLANPEATDEELQQVCELACIHDYITKLPHGYQTLIGENGLKLSGGQKQRLAIARALLRHSKIILFDEATSALDNESQIKIQSAIDYLAREHTVLIIAHRLTTILSADEIILIADGQIAGRGTHQSLLNTSALYRNLYATESKAISNRSVSMV